MEVPRVRRNEGPKFGWSPRKRVTRSRAIRNRDRTEQPSFAQVVSWEVAQSGTDGNVGGAQGEEQMGWRGSKVDTEASSQEGSLGASLCDSADSKIEVGGGGRVGNEGGGGMDVVGDGGAGNEGLA
ncbi:hypothetical protein ACSQ67_025343 [Phaseolus vulgaris]